MAQPTHEKPPLLSQRTRDKLMLFGGVVATLGGIYYVYTVAKKPAEKAIHAVTGTPTARQTTAPVTPRTIRTTVVKTVVKTVPRTPHTTPRPTSTTAMTYRAPQTVPSFVTRKCGTVYVSLGLWRNRTGLAYIAKYVDGHLVAQYPQPEPAGSPWLTANTWSGGYACPGSTPTYTYTVQPGDTLSGIAACTGSTVSQLAALNHIANVNYIEVGQVLTVPNPCVSGRTAAAQLQVVSAQVQGVN